MFAKNKTLWAKVESSYATDPTPAGTDAILTRNFQIQPYTGPVVSRNLDRSTLGGQTTVNTDPQVQLSFEVELAGSGAAATVVAWDSLIKGCGFSRAQASPTSGGYLYTPLSSSFPSLTFWYYEDGERQVINGARGNVAFSFARGEIPAMTYTFIGRYARPTAATPTGTDISDFSTPLAVTYTNTPTLTLGGSPLTALRAESFAFDMGNNIVSRNIIGANEIMITDRNPTGSILMEAVLPSTKDWFAGGIESHSGVTTLVANFIHGTTAGNRIRVQAPAVQITGVTRQESDNIKMFNMATALVPVSGNDEVTITTY